MTGIYSISNSKKTTEAQRLLNVNQSPKNVLKLTEHLKLSRNLLESWQIFKEFKGMIEYTRHRVVST